MDERLRRLHAGFAQRGNIGRPARGHELGSLPGRHERGRQPRSSGPVVSPPPGSARRPGRSRARMGRRAVGPRAPRGRCDRGSASRDRCVRIGRHGRPLRGTVRGGRVIESEHKEKVREFVDNEAGRYARQRYGDEEPQVARPDLERTELVLEMFDGDGKDVLDIGCGPGVLEPYLLDRGCRVTAIDFAANMIDQARESLKDHPKSANVSFAEGSADALPFPDASFDAFVCIGVLSYVPDTDRALREVARVLRPSGTGVLQSQNVFSLWELEHRFVRVPYHWTVTKLTGRDIRDANFKILRFWPARMDARLARAGLVVEDFRFYDFYVPFLGRLAPNADARFSAVMRRHRRSRLLGHLGTGYLVKGRRR